MRSRYSKACGGFSMNARATSRPNRVGRGRVAASPSSMNPPVSRFGRFTLALAVLGCAVTRFSRAQTPDDRAAIERFRDSLATTADTSGLLELEKRMIAAAKADRNNAV